MNSLEIFLNTYNNDISYLWGNIAQPREIIYKEHNSCALNY